ncbi:MAG: hypothetical protein F4Y45_01965 [Acidobacteria bacterium]|nr:hypothetical protein [Acidobacteriota bacterium]MYJ03858.1 hypothetical protein [Acidobacteriota bacterium]
MSLSALAAATCLIAAGAFISLAAQSESTLERLLADQVDFSDDDLRALDDGAVVITTLDTRVRQELAHIGVVYLDVSAAEFVDRFRDIEAFESGPGIPQIGRFSDPPRIEDLQGLTLPEVDLESLPYCRPGDCELKLSTDGMKRFRNEVDWTSPTAAEQANQIAREMILELLLAYRAEGNGALGAYADSDRPMAVAEQFRGLLTNRDPLPNSVPALLTYLEHYPLGLPPGADEFFYWTVADFGLKQTIRVNHVTIYPLASGAMPGEVYAIAIKQLYASHYFHTTLELRFVTGHPLQSDRDGSALVSITRSRNDGMTGFKGFFLRPIIRGRSRDAVRGYLEHVRRQVESPAPTTKSRGTSPPTVP